MSSWGAGDEAEPLGRSWEGLNGPGKAPPPKGIHQHSLILGTVHSSNKPCLDLPDALLLPGTVPLPGMLHPSCSAEEILLHFKDSFTHLLCDVFF